MIRQAGAPRSDRQSGAQVLRDDYGAGRDRNLDLWYRRLHLDDAINEHGDAMGRPRPQALRARPRQGDRQGPIPRDGEATERRDGKLRSSPATAHRPHRGHRGGQSEDEIREYIEHLLRAYRRFLPDAAGALLDQYHRYVHAARKVCSAPQRRHALLDRPPRRRDDSGDPLFLQVKEAGAWRSPTGSPATATGTRVVASSRPADLLGAGDGHDALLGWMSAAWLSTTADCGEFYACQLWDGKASVNVALMDPSSLGAYGELCGATLARAHARRGGDRIATTWLPGQGRRLHRGDDALRLDLRRPERARLRGLPGGGR